MLDMGFVSAILTSQNYLKQFVSWQILFNDEL